MAFIDAYFVAFNFTMNVLKKNRGNKGLIVRNPIMLVIDEAHNFEEKVRGALTDQVTEDEVDNLLDEVFKLLSFRYYDVDLNKKIKHLKNINRQIFMDIKRQVEELKRTEEVDAERFSFTSPPNIDYYVLQDIISDIITNVQIYEVGKREREVEEALDKLYSIENTYKILSNEERGYLIWATLENEKIKLNSCPKNIDSFLKVSLFKGNTPVVLTSATLCQDGDKIEDQYRYVAQSLGFVGEFSEPKTSPFNYVENAIMYISDKTPLYKKENREEYLDSVIMQIIDLCNITEGRTLVLFTAKEDLNFVVEKIDSIQTPWKKIYQIEGSNQDIVIDKFRESKGVLFGTGIFWEGINIPGPDLSQVIIVRLPFPVPNDPVTKYKISKSQDPFREIMIPEMLIKLRQGSGRLIRTEDDTGILSILDSRLSIKEKKSYRESVLNMLPFKNYTENLEEVKIFAQKKIPRIS